MISSFVIFLQLDLREIGSGEGEITQGNLILQIQKLRNVSAPKNNEESRSAPRMLKLYLTDGKNNYQAVEIENISSIRYLLIYLVVFIGINVICKFFFLFFHISLHRFTYNFYLQTV